MIDERVNYNTSGFQKRAFDRKDPREDKTARQKTREKFARANIDRKIKRFKKFNEDAPANATGAAKPVLVLHRGGGFWLGVIGISGKTAEHTAKLMRERFGFNWRENLDGVNLISIGPQTTISCEKYFSRHDEQADPHDLEGLIHACILSLSKQ